MKIQSDYNTKKELTLNVETDEGTQTAKLQQEHTLVQHAAVGDEPEHRLQDDEPEQLLSKGELEGVAEPSLENGVILSGYNIQKAGKNMPTEQVGSGGKKAGKGIGMYGRGAAARSTPRGGAREEVAAVFVK